MKMKKRITALLLVMLLAASVGLTACGNDPEKETGGASTQPVTGSEQTTEPAEKLEIPEDGEFYGSTVLFAVHDGVWTVSDIAVEENDQTLIVDAIYRRNEMIRQKYGITIEQTKQADLMGAVNKAVQAGGVGCDAIGARMDQAVSMAQSGWLLDMAYETGEVPYVDFSKSWWDGALIDGLSLNNKIYYGTGEIASVDNSATFIMMFNKKMQKNFALDNPYDLVVDGTWTREKMQQMMKVVADDTNGNGKADYNADRFGLSGGMEMITAMFYSSGLSITKKNEDDIPEYGLDVSKTDDYLNWCKSTLGSAQQTVIFHWVTADQDFKNARLVFTEERGLFYGECLGTVNGLRDFSVTFGVLPYPKTDESQEQYYSYVNSVATVVAVPKSTAGTTLDLVGATLEAMAYYSKTTLTPAYYDYTLVAKGLRDEESAPMLDLILANRVFDPGYVYDWGGYTGRIQDMVKGNANIASSASALKKMFTSKLNATLKAYGY